MSDEYAFPSIDKGHFSNPGATKRELLAVLIMTGILAGGSGMKPQDLCKFSVELADELIKVLNKSQPGES